MELKTIIGFLMALLWVFLRNYERKPRVMPPAPVPVPSDFPAAGGTKPHAVPKMRSSAGPKARPAEKIIRKNAPSRAAFPVLTSSDFEKGGAPQENISTESIDQQTNEFAESVRFNIRSREGAREAFIYQEIFSRKNF